MASKKLYTKQVREQKAAISERFGTFKSILAGEEDGSLSMPTFKPIESHTEPGTSTSVYIHASNLMAALLVEARRSLALKTALEAEVDGWDPAEDVEWFIQIVESFLHGCTMEGETATVNTEGATVENGTQTIENGKATTENSKAATQTMAKSRKRLVTVIEETSEGSNDDNDECNDDYKGFSSLLHPLKTTYYDAESGEEWEGFSD